MSRIAAALPCISGFIPFIERENKILKSFFTGPSAKSGAKTIQAVIINTRTWLGFETSVFTESVLSIIDGGTRAVESLFDVFEVSDRIIRLAKHIPVLLTGEASFLSLAYDSVELAVCTLSAGRGMVHKAPKKQNPDEINDISKLKKLCKQEQEKTWKWGLGVDHRTYMWLTLGKMTGSGLWKLSTVVIAKWNVKMDPFKRYRDIFIAAILLQCAVNAFFDFFCETDSTKLANDKAYQAYHDARDRYKNASPLTRFVGFSWNGWAIDPATPVQKDSTVRHFTWIRSLFCNGLARRVTGLCISFCAYMAQRNAYMATAA